MKTLKAKITLKDVVTSVETYTQTGDLTIQQAKSPVSLVKPGNLDPFVPLFLINSWNDTPPPYHQIVDMICALKAADVPDSAYQTLTIPGDEHSFAYWDSWDGISSPHKTVGQDVIDFLNAHLMPTPTPSPTPTP